MKTWLQRGLSLFIVCLIMAGPIAIRADAVENIILTGSEQQVEATITLPDTKGSVPIRSLQLSFQIRAIQGKIEKEQVAFEFHKDIQSDIREWRYQEDTGRLTVYLSGDHDLYAKEDLKLGAVKLALNDGTKGEVSVLENSLKTVDDHYAMNEITGMDTAASVSLEKAAKPDKDTPQEEEKKEQEATSQQPPAPQQTPDAEDENAAVKLPDTKDQNTEQTVDAEQSKGTDSADTQNGTRVDTGDHTQAQLYALCMLGAMAAGGILLVMKKKKQLHNKG